MDEGTRMVLNASVDGEVFDEEEKVYEDESVVELVVIYRWRT